MEEQDVCRRHDVATTELADRAQRFIRHVAQVVSLAGNREAAFQAVFGCGGLYFRVFPTLDDRMALRDLPLGRAEVFRLVSSLPVKDPSDSLPGDSLAGPGIQDTTHQPPALELLEDRVLLASDAAVPIAAAAVEGMPAEPAAYVAAEHAGHGFVDLTSVAAAVDVPTDSGSATHDDSSSPIPTHAAESHAEIVENQKEPPETRGPETGELIEHDMNRNEFGLATIEPEPSKLPQDRELTRQLIGDHGNGSLLSQPTDTGNAIGEVDVGTAADEVAVEVAVKTVAEELSTGILQGTPVPGAVVLDGSGNLSAEQPIKNDVLPDTQADVSIHTALHAEPASDTGDTAEAIALGNQGGITDVADGNSGPPCIVDAVDSPPEVHDALFATGGGVETVLERPSA